MMEWISVKDKSMRLEGKFMAIDKDSDIAVVWYEDAYLIRNH